MRKKNTSKRSKKVHKILLIGMGINALLILVKAAAGLRGHSSALVADAYHSFSDFITDLVVMLGFRFSVKPVDDSHDYGHGKIETLTTLIIGAVLIFIGAKIMLDGINNCYLVFKGLILAQPSWMAFGAAFISLLAKEVLYRYSYLIGRRVNSPSLVANAWHHRSDALSSIGVMLGIAGAILLGEKWRILDPLAAIIVSSFIIKAAFSILSKSANELTEASLSDEEKQRIIDLARQTAGVEHPHNLKTRRIGKDIVIDLHIEVDPLLNVTRAHDISSALERKLKISFGQDTIITVHIEPEGYK